MKIYIHHLVYTIHIKDKYHKHMGNLPSCERMDNNNCILWLPKKIRREVTTVAHEVMHVLQYIAEARDINMTAEQEHMGYLMQYIMAKVLQIKLIPKR